MIYVDTSTLIALIALIALMALVAPARAASALRRARLAAARSGAIRPSGTGQRLWAPDMSDRRLGLHRQHGIGRLAEHIGRIHGLDP